MKSSYYLVGQEGIDILEQDGIETLIKEIISRGFLGELFCEVIKFGRSIEPDDIMQVACSYSDYLRIDKRTFDRLDKALLSYASHLINNNLS